MNHEILIAPKKNDAISIDHFIIRREQRRRRVAKRLHKRVPLFAVEEMQKEFPHYTLDQHIEDISRKSRKSKSSRKPKKRAFDWVLIKDILPDFFEKCFKKTPTKAYLRGRLHDGKEFIAVVNSVYNSSDMGGYNQAVLTLHDLTKMWRGGLKMFLSHASVSVEYCKQDFNK